MEGLDVCVIGHSEIVGKPIALLALQMMTAAGLVLRVGGFEY